MDIRIGFSGGKRVDAHFDGRVVQTDQSPLGGGDGSAPEPFQLFLSSLATCAGIYVLGFCQARGIPTDGIEMVQRHDFDMQAGRLTGVSIDITVPDDFPAKYVPALERVAAKCAVKRVIENPPAFDITAKTRSSAQSSSATA